MAEYHGELKELVAASKKLSDEAMAGGGDSAARVEEAGRLEERLFALADALDSAPEEEQDELAMQVYDIQRNIKFVRAMAAPPAADPDGQARQVNREAYSLATSFVDGTVDGDDARQQAEGLLDRLKSLTGGEQTADMRRLLAEAHQEIQFVLKGGNVPVSPRIAQYQRDKQH